MQPDEKELERKIAAGLTRGQAIEVIKRQTEADRAAARVEKKNGKEK